MRVFLDANILFSAAKSDGAIRQLLRNLKLSRHTLVADTYVQTEAKRNIAAKADAQAVRDLDALLSQVEVSAVQCSLHNRHQHFKPQRCGYPKKTAPYC
jgi:uncharacterized protein